MNKNQKPNTTFSLCRSLVDTALIKEKVGADLYELQIIRGLEKCDQEDRPGTTKFLFRYFLDLVLALFQVPFSSELTEITDACLECAIEVFKSQDFLVGNQLQIQNISSTVGNPSNLLQNVKALIVSTSKGSQSTLSFSPYDYLFEKISSEVLGTQVYTKITKGVCQLIDLALSYPDLGAYTSEEIFTGCLKAILAEKSASIGPETTSYLLGKTGTEENNPVMVFLLQLLAE